MARGCRSSGLACSACGAPDCVGRPCVAWGSGWWCGKCFSALMRGGGLADAPAPPPPRPEPVPVTVAAPEPLWAGVGRLLEREAELKRRRERERASRCDNGPELG